MLVSENKKCSACNFIRLLLVSLALAAGVTWLAGRFEVENMTAMLCGVFAALIPWWVSGVKKRKGGIKRSR